MEVDEQLTESREPQRSKESTGGKVLPVGPQVLPVGLYEDCGNCPRIHSIREGTIGSKPKWEDHFGRDYKKDRTQVFEGSSFLSEVESLLFSSSILGFRF